MYSNFLIPNSGSAVPNSNFRVLNPNTGVPNSNFPVSNSDFRVLNPNAGVPNSNFPVSNSDFRVLNPNAGVPNSDFLMYQYYVNFLCYFPKFHGYWQKRENYQLPPEDMEVGGAALKYDVSQPSAHRIAQKTCYMDVVVS